MPAVELRGKSILVVGASGALGSLITDRLESQGALLTLTSTKPVEPRAGAMHLMGDIRDSADRFVHLASDRNGALDGVIITSGVVAFGPASELSPETLERLFAVNATGPMRIIASAQPALAASATAQRQPFIVTLSGVVAEAPTAGLAAYSASKSALAAFGQAAGRELRRAGIRLLDARPGHTETGLASRAIEGIPPAFPPGLNPALVADRIMQGILDNEKDLPSLAFNG